MWACSASFALCNVVLKLLKRGYFLGMKGMPDFSIDLLRSRNSWVWTEWWVTTPFLNLMSMFMSSTVLAAHVFILFRAGMPISSFLLIVCSSLSVRLPWVSGLGSSFFSFFNVASCASMSLGQWRLLVAGRLRIEFADLETLPVVMNVVAKHGCFGLFN